MAENSKSQGSFGLSHFRNSRASQDLFEPVYLNLFTIQIALPEKLGASDQQTNLLLENVIKIGGLKSSKFPDSPVAQQYKWATRRFAGAKPSETTMDITIDFEVNLDKSQSAYVVKTLRKWCDLVYDPLTGRTGVKEDYVSPWALITMYDRAARPFWQWKLFNLFPLTGIPEVPLEYMSTDIFKVTGFSLGAETWDETIV